MEKEYLKILNNKNIGEYHYLHVPSDTLLLPDVCENLRINVLKYMNLIDPACFLSAPGLAWKACFKKYRNKIRLASKY